MRIQHNIMAMNANRNLGVNNRNLSKNLEKLSSGYRINRAGDDAAGLAISEKMRADVAIYDQAINNANDGISMIQTAEGALQEVHDMLNRMETLATQAANGTYGSTELTKINAEVTALESEITRIQNTTKFNGIQLFGTAKNIDFQVGQSAANTISLNKNDIKTLTVNIDLTTQSKALNAIADIKGHIETVSTTRGNLGALQNRLEHTVKNLGVTMENLQNAESQVRDTDIAEEMMAYTKNNILIQSAQAMLAQANQVPQGVLQLMQ